MPRTRPPRFVLQEHHAQVERDRIEAAREHDSRPARLRRRGEAGNHVCHPARLAAQVDVVGAGLRAGFHQGLTVALVRADGGDHDAGLPHQRGHRRRVGRVGSEERQGGRRTDFAAHFGELVQIAPRHRPGHLFAHAVGGVQVLGHEPPGESGGAEDDDVEVSFHAQSSHTVLTLPLHSGPAPMKA
jgi:hypothetical protein